ncbi:unnamed protein product [Pseudo-nitzschia multistriata]|uniref:Uncharacterized protein n=1 Tax=Pseudo-nitzschia multistriata TaxID=183589 RepID=A0A448Z9A9_9STRA|nr:unnamed protein product [Pseudo-nitzschia multistriata]
MQISSNALTLYVIVASTSTYAFVHRPRLLPTHLPSIEKGGTALGYIKENYETGIGPDILRKHKRKPDVIDAIVVEEVVLPTDVGSSQTSTRTTPTPTHARPKRSPNTRIRKELSPDFDDAFISEDVPATAPLEPSIWDTNTAKCIQGGALRTWAIGAPEVDHTQVLLKSTHWDSPLRAQIDVYNGPGHAPMKLAVYCAESLSQQPFSFVIPTPGFNHQSIGIKNSGPFEFPIEAVAIADVESAREQRKRQRERERQHTDPNTQPLQQGGYTGFYNSVDPTPARTTLGAGRHEERPTSGLGLFAEKLRDLGDLRKIEGTSPVEYASGNEQSSSEELFEFEKNVDSVQVLIETRGLSCQARIEVTSNGCDEILQVIELSIEDGKERPFFAVLDTSQRTSTTVRVLNLDPYSAFPITACVEPYTINSDDDDDCNYKHDEDQAFGFDFIDASIEEDQGSDDEMIATAAASDSSAADGEGESDMYAVPDITIPASLADYDFDEEFFFAS